VFYQGSNFGTSVYVYMWDPTSGDKQLSGAWPGTAVTHLSDDKFKFVVPASATGEPSNWKIIWNNGNGGDGNQTADLDFTMHGLYNFNGCNGKVTALCDGGETPNPDDDPKPEDPKEGITVKALMPAHWTETITAWVWPEGGEGRVVTPSKDGDWYVVTEDTEVLNIIFRNGTDWNGNPNQTEDMQFTANTCIQLSQSGDAKATYGVVDCPIATDVENVGISKPTARKIIINQSLYLIMPDGKMYDVSGKLVR
jgi:hypothetical protein